jgi:GntR family transcriptional regulator
MAFPDRQGADGQRKPLHARLVDELLGRIRAGEWPVGSTLPSEMELCGAAGVSRHTLRHALKTLQERGFIERRQGAPSKVISSTQPRIYSQDFNTLKEVLRYPRNTYRENITERTIECDARLQAALKAPLGSSWFHIGAVRREEQSTLPLAWTDIYIQHRFARVAKLAGHAREMVFEQIERQFGVAIDRAEIEVEASSLSREHARLLAVSPGTPCLVITRRYFDATGEPFEVTVTRHPEQRFTFNMELRGISRSFAHQGVSP